MFDAAGRSIATQDALAKRTTTVSRVASGPIARLNAPGGISTTNYDLAGRVKSSVNALGAVTTPVYDSFSRPSAVINARGFRSTTVYDSFGRAAARQDALGNLSTTLFDSFGRVSGIMDPAGFPTTATFDALDRPIAVQDALGHVNTTLYDTLGRVQATVDASNHTSTTVYDSAGRPLAQVNALGYRTTFGYDKRGSRIAVTNARGFTWTASFDALGRNSASVDPLGRRTTLAFDARSLVSQQTDGKGQVETRTYDALGRQTGTQYADGTIVTTTFDLLSRKLTEANQNGLWTRTYDALSQRLTEVGPVYPSGLPLTSVYDTVGNRTALQTWRGVQTWGYDALNRSRTLVDIEGGTYTWSCEARSYLSRLDYPNGVIFSVAYGSTGRPWQGSYSSAADSQVEMAEYDAFDAVDNPTRITQFWGGTHSNTRDLTYDAANQMTQWSDSDTNGPTTVLDPAGNPSSATVGAYSFAYTYDAADELKNLTTTQPIDPGFISATFSYDGNGNRIVEQNYQNGSNGTRTDLTTYTWDAANRLLKIQQSAAGAVDLTNSYRPDGLRHQRTDVNGTTQILWDGDEPLAQVDNTGAVKKYWSRAEKPLPSGKWSRLVKVRVPGNPFPDQYLHSDWQGTVLASSGSTGAALVQGRGPRAWGQDGLDLAPFSWLGNHGYWYEGQLTRPMHYVRARWFVDGGPGVGGAPGWLSPDPLRFGSGDWNLYRYVGNRPTAGVDPAGTVPQLDASCGCLPGGWSGLINPCIAAFCAAVNTPDGAHQIRQCARDHGLPSDTDVTGCMKEWCATGSPVHCCNQASGCRDSNFPNGVVCSRTLTAQCRRPCVLRRGQPPAIKTIHIPGCAVSNGGAVPGVRHPGVQMYYCCYWHHQYYQDCPNDPKVGQVGWPNFNCQGAPDQLHVWLHELGHACTGVPSDDPDVENQPGQLGELNQFVNCVTSYLASSCAPG